MRYLYPEWPAILRRIQKAKSSLLLFDYDGTLAPIAPTPAEAILSNTNRRLLARIAQIPRVQLGVISGRRLDDVKEMVTLRGLWYAGNHGLEIEREEMRFIHPGAQGSKRVLRYCGQWLASQIRTISGAWVEQKGLSLSLHYRLVAASRLKEFYGVVDRSFRARDISERFDVRHGKKTFEIMPRVAWHKGRAIEWIRKKLSNPSFVFYIGDEQTDEDAFGVLGRKDAAIRVGHSRESSAHYYLRRQTEISRLLGSLAGMESR